MEEWQAQIHHAQSLEQLDHIRDEVLREIESHEQDLELLQPALDAAGKTYHQMCEKRDGLRDQIRDKQLLFEQIAFQRNRIEEDQKRHRQEPCRCERASWSHTQWLNEIAELKQDGFPESDEEILQLLEAYSHVNAAEEDLLKTMRLLSDHNTRKDLYAPCWIQKQGRSSTIDVDFEMYDVEASENFIEFWTDERYYYMKLDFYCGCKNHRDYDDCQTCEKLSIRLMEENEHIILHDIQNNMIAVDRKVCSWNSILLFDFSVLTCCWQSCWQKCESAPMTMVFAPCYLQKHFARDDVRARRVLAEIIDHLDNSDDSVEYFTKARLEQAEADVDADTVVLELNDRGNLFEIIINTEKILINVAGTTSEVSDELLMSEYENAWEVYMALGKFFEEYEQRG